MTNQKKHYRLIGLAIASLAGATIVAQPAHADHRSHKAKGTGTLVFTGEATEIIEKRNGTIILIDLPVAGTIDAVGKRISIQGTFTGADTLTANETRSKVRGTRVYELVGYGTCTGQAKGVGPNDVGGVDFVEKLRCADGTKIKLNVHDASPLDDELGFNRTITAEVDD